MNKYVKILFNILFFSSFINCSFAQYAQQEPSNGYKPYLVGDNIVAYINRQDGVVLAQVNKNLCSSKQGEIAYEDNKGTQVIKWVRADNDRNYQITRFLCNSGAKSLDKMAPSALPPNVIYSPYPETLK